LLLAGSSSVTLVTQVVKLEQGHRDPYRTGTLQAELDETDWRDYTLYAIEGAGTYLVPIGLGATLCGACGHEAKRDLPFFGEAQLLAPADLRCPGCQAVLDLSRDKAVLLSGDVFLLEEVCRTAALSIELAEAPESEELPDAAVGGVLREAFGELDELAHEDVEPA